LVRRKEEEGGEEEETWIGWKGGEKGGGVGVGEIN